MKAKWETEKNSIGKVQKLREELENANAELAAALQALFTTSPRNAIKKSKAGDKEVDLTSMVRSIKSVYDTASGEIRISALLSAGMADHLNPELLIKAAKDRGIILCGNPAKETYSILRTHVYTEDGTTEFR